MSQAVHTFYDAARDLVHHFPGGGDALGALLGKRPGVLNNEINPNLHGPKLGLIDAARAEAFAQSYPILHAYARFHGFVCYRLPAPDIAVGDLSLLEAFARWQGANGATCEEIRRAVDPDSDLGPGISCEEVARIAAAGERLAVEWLELLARFRQIAQPEPATE